ncbi:hypothetical protein [Candidatus Methanoperedens nitratireducens]|uniref:hypothetical protein n=1 Tax=Candidatus Methanoperedens nitratireducens TaxID=1392998 RepID=UPI00211C0538|nr:hypothetical protein [Candidatus Methanoperedens nitroreducens]
MGQLDGGHVLRAMVGEKVSRLSIVLPLPVIPSRLMMMFLWTEEGWLLGLLLLFLGCSV